MAVAVLAVAGVISPTKSNKPSPAAVAAAATSAPAPAPTAETRLRPVTTDEPSPESTASAAPAAIPLRSTAAAEPAAPTEAGPGTESADVRPTIAVAGNAAWATVQAACDEGARATEGASRLRPDDRDANVRGASSNPVPACQALTDVMVATAASVGAASSNPAMDASAASMSLASTGGNGAGGVLGIRALDAAPPILLAAATPAVTASHPRMILDSATLTALRQRMTANTAEWQSLKSACDSLIGGTVNYPSQDNYPDLPNLGQGYQGETYLPALLNEALCYQVLRASNPTAAAPYGAKAVDILMKMSTPFTSGGQGEDPMTDDGYVIRFYGVGFGLGYDWLYDLLSPSQRTQVYTTANTWLTEWEDPNEPAAFEYEHPQGNYFAGYFHAKATIALGTYGDNPSAPTQWDNWYNTQFLGSGRVQPYYALHLLGGGWPEGFGNYGPLAIFNMSMPAREVMTATGTDIVHAAAAPYSYPLDSADYVMHFTWPSRAYFDDRDTNHSGGTANDPPGTVQVGLFQEIIGELTFWGSSKVAVFNDYMSEVNSATSGYDMADPWLRFLEVDPNASKGDVTTLPLSYLASGMGAVSARSDWGTGATWMSFRAGPYINNPGAGEEYFDQGSLALVRGASPLLVNAGGWVVHDPNGTNDETNVFNDNYQSGNTVFQGNRQLYNVFYVRNMSGTTVVSPYGQSANTAEEDGVRTKVSAYEDGKDYVYMLATNLEDMYRKFGSSTAVAGWSREVVYLRPNRFVVYDRTTSGNASYDQYMAWHFPASPVAGTAASGQKRLDITYGGKYMGAMTAVLPANVTTTTVPLYPNSNPVKAWQVQVRPGASGVSQQWLTVFDLSASAGAVATTTPVTVTQGAAIGVRLAATDGNSVVVSSSGTAGTPISGSLAYSIPTATSLNIVTDLAVATGYNVTVSTSGSTQTITLSPGGTFVSSARGVLDFYVTASGTVQQSTPATTSIPISSMPVGSPIPYKP